MRSLRSAFVPPVNSAENLESCRDAESKFHRDVHVYHYFPRGLSRTLRPHSSVSLVAFDSEFVSDIGYRPQLGLLQFATPERCVAVDPLEVSVLSSWWDTHADENVTVVVHGGQAEIRFCVQLSG